MTKKIVFGHASDTHGVIWPEISDESDFVIHSGDGLPNYRRENVKKEEEIKFQSEWVENNIDNYRKWLKGKPFFYCSGNHCFISPVDILKEAGINAVDITNKIYNHEGITLFGFPYINYIDGEWNYECYLDEMDKHIRRLKDVLIDNKVDILVAHSPMANLLDWEKRHYGITLMANMFIYELEEKYWPKLYCHGHVHGSGNQTAKLGSMIVSNAAMSMNLLEYDGT